MRVSRCRLAMIASFVAVISAQRVAFAEEPAVQKFTAGMDASDKREWARAETLFTESITIAPSVGAYFNRGYCREQMGHLEDAYRDYRKAEDLAHVRGDTREATAKEGAVRLTPRLHFVELIVPSSVLDVEGLQLTVDGAAVEKGPSPIIVFSGRSSHSVEVRAPKHKTWSEAGLSDHASVTTQLGEQEIVPKDASTSQPSSQPSGWPTSRYVAVGLAGAGVVTLATSAVIFVTGASHLDDLKRERDTACRGTDAALCASKVDAAKSYRSDVATPTTVLDIAGGALVAAGAVVWFAFPGSKEKTAVLSPSLSREGGGVTLRAAW